MSAPVYWSIILSGLGISGIYLGEKRPKIGWTICIVDEVVWIIYSVITHQYAFIVSAIAYTHVYYRRYRLEHESKKPFQEARDKGLRERDLAKAIRNC